MDSQKQGADPAAAVPQRRSNGGGAQFAARRLDHNLARLAVHWKACSECGGRELQRPRPDDLAHAIEADGVCESCGAMFTCGGDGSPLLLSPGRFAEGLPS